MAIEPDPRNLRILQLMCRLNGVQPIVLPCAITDQDGETRLVLARNEGGHQVDINQPAPLGSIRVDSLTLRSIVKKYGKIDLVKVDIESAEWLVLKGAEGCTDSILSWVVEVHVPDQKGVEACFLKRGYFVLWLDKKHLYAGKKLERHPFRVDTGHPQIWSKCPEIGG